MNTITRLVIYVLVVMACATVQSQETKIDSTQKSENELKINALKRLKVNIESQERESLKEEIEAINQRLDDDKITAKEAEELKKEAAKKRAANIENRLAIIDNKIALLKRNDSGYNPNDSDGDGFVFRIGGDEDSSESFMYFGKKSNDKPKKYDKRTTYDIVFAIGFNNALIEGQSLDDSPYKLGGSGFVELGFNWETRVFKNTNFLRFKYGFSFQWNKFDIKDDKFFVQNDDVTTLEEFPVELKKAKFRVTNLVFPIHFELGPSKKKDYKDRIRYTTDNQFKIGVGGYGGVRLGSQQKLKFEEDGNNVKQKTKSNFNASNFVYGLSGYVGVGHIMLYAKYDLSPLFKDQAIDQNNISLGIRLDLE